MTVCICACSCACKPGTIYVTWCLCMVELHQRAGGTEGTNTALQSAASLAVQSAGFQPLVRLQPANLLSRAGTYTVPKHTARQHSFLCLIWQKHRVNALSHKAQKKRIFYFFFFSFMERHVLSHAPLLTDADLKIAWGEMTLLVVWMNNWLSARLKHSLLLTGHKPDVLTEVSRLILKFILLWTIDLAE